jgi:hypothetical protein
VRAVAIAIEIANNCLVDCKRFLSDGKPANQQNEQCDLQNVLFFACYT